ncbi:uncharacterized protein LOC115456364 isoform X1 [Manduca sexta]|uniref:Uncharacterized protein n=1 Tax=Manduca sexta TaxID=7130 RepID=A0A921YRJ9_MANSE|nr:uncharacterized protein LOC115456364 isoform X1 [Manduca sexta]KAG6444098.1 hypothetical protein O3G_MSEX003198 [Manduca sexta]
MNVFKIVFAVLLQITYLKSMLTKDFVNDVNSRNGLNSKYFIIVKKDDDNDYNKIDQVDQNHNGAYYLIFDKNLKPVQRRFRDLKKDREERKQAELLKTQQERKVKEITEFIKDHQMTTNFLYDEVQRIKRQRQVKDDLRRMVEYLEKPGKGDMRLKVLKCYYQARKEEPLSRDIWGLETNNLVINVLKDPYNYGYIN